MPSLAGSWWRSYRKMALLSLKHQVRWQHIILVIPQSRVHFPKKVLFISLKVEFRDKLTYAGLESSKKTVQLSLQS